MRCSRCSSALVTPEQFEFGLCETCLRGAKFEPLDLTPEDFLEQLLEFAKPSLERETLRDACAVADRICESMKHPSKPIGSIDRVIGRAVNRTPTDLEWKAQHIKTSEVQ